MSKIIKVLVKPNSTRGPLVQKTYQAGQEVYLVWVPEPATEGKANQAVRLALVDYLQIKKNKLTLTRGAKSKVKFFLLTE